MDFKSKKLNSGKQLQSQAVRAGQYRSDEGEHCEPIFTTSSYVFESAEHAAAVFSEQQEGNVYSRYTNPTVRTLEQRIAAMEGTDAAVATASGMAAILSVCMTFLEAGDHVVCSRSVFGTTTGLFNNYMKKFGVDVDFANLTDLDDWLDKVTSNTKLFFVETPSNPLCQVADITALSEIAHDNDALLVVDNTCCTPVLQRPIEHGADIVLYSGTKYLDGQGRTMGGLVVAEQKYIDPLVVFLRTAGPSMSPFNAWILLKGLETLNLRMKAHSSNAAYLAKWLNEQSKIEQVYFTGLDDHPQKQLIDKQQSGAGGVLSFKVKGDREQAWKFINATEMVSLTANLGDTKTTIVHPATTTHGRLTDEQKDLAGITENLIRVSVGLEDIEDIILDLKRGLDSL